MTNYSSKSVIIDGYVHSKLKEHCKARDLKIGKILEKIIEVYLANTKEMQTLIDNYNETNNE